MKRMTKEEKLAKEELTKTQVLNLNELERIANYEKRTSKKPALILAVLGIMCITIGVSYSGVLSILDSTNNSPKNSVEHKEVDDTSKQSIATMSCKYTNFGGEDGTDTTVDMTLIFNNGKLSNYTKVMSLMPTSGKEGDPALTISQLLIAYQSFETLNIPGYKISSNAKGNGFETIVSLELKSLDPTQLNIYHQGNVVTKVEFALDDTKEMVFEKAKDLGYICQ